MFFQCLLRSIWLQIEIENCTIGNDDSVQWIHRGIYIEVNQTTSDKPVTYHIRDTVFEKQIFRDPVISAINLFYGPLTLKVQQSSNINLNVAGMKLSQSDTFLMFEIKLMKMPILSLQNAMKVMRAN